MSVPDVGVSAAPASPSPSPPPLTNGFDQQDSQPVRSDNADSRGDHPARRWSSEDDDDDDEEFLKFLRGELPEDEQDSMAHQERLLEELLRLRLTANGGAASQNGSVTSGSGDSGASGSALALRQQRGHLYQPRTKEEQFEDILMEAAAMDVLDEADLFSQAADMAKEAEKKYNAQWAIGIFKVKPLGKNYLLCGRIILAKLFSFFLTLFSCSF